MSELRRASDKNGLAKVANNPVVTFAFRALTAMGVTVVLPFLGWFMARAVGVLDGVVAQATELTKNVAVISSTVNGHEKRIEKIENKVFR